MSERERLAAVAEYLDVQPQAGADLTALCELATIACDVSYAAVNLIDDRVQHSVAAVGIDPSICSRDDSMCAVTVDSAAEVYVEDARTDPRFADNPWVDGRRGEIRLYVAAPMISPSDEIVGAFCVFDLSPPRPVERRRGLPERRRRAMRQIAAQAVDVLELQLRTVKLAETVAELARSHEQLAAFAGQISHDLKSPLTATIGFAEMLTEHPSISGDENARRYAQRCLASGQRMMTMIDGLLGYARVGGTLQKQQVPLDEIMPAVLEDLGARTQDADVRWSGADVPADPAQLRALLQNLVGNSLIYRRPGVRTAVDVTATTTPIGTELVITDNGSGIPPDRRADVLAPLGRLRDDVPGTGLGLATCARIAAAHGGSLHLSDTPGGGLTVTVLLPS